VRSGRAAEFVLSCVLPVDRAAAVTGDFIEEFGASGGFWFWSSVLRTVAARVTSDFVRRPFLMLGIGMAGCLRIVAPVLVLAMIAAPFAPYGHRWVLDWIAGLVIVPWRFRCGMWLGRYRPKSAIASCVSVILLGWIWMLIIHTTPPRSTANYVMGGMNDVLLISGALWTRYRNVRQTWRVARA
jgi:hypothetical protein